MVLIAPQRDEVIVEQTDRPTLRMTEYLEGVATTVNEHTTQIAAVVFTEAFTSSEQTITSGGLLTLPHTLSSIPYLIMPYLICTTAELGYSIDDEVLINPAGNDPGGTGSRGFSVVPSDTTINIRYGNDVAAIKLIRKDTGASADITNANWKLIIRAWA